MIKYIFSFFFAYLLFSNLNASTIKINSFHSNEWKNEWTDSINRELSKEENSGLMNRFIDEEDLESLGCPDFNYASIQEKKDFWVVFFSSLARSESGLNEKAKSPSHRGHRSYGLLQLASDTAMNNCNLIFLDEEILNGEDNLACGVKLLNWQLNGAPSKSGKLKRPDLENQLFGKGILLWGPLRQNDKNGRKRLYSWFNAHVTNLEFCRL